MNETKTTQTLIAAVLPPHRGNALRVRGGSAIRAHALADGIPAESYAAGANKLADENPQWGDDRNRNMPRMPSVVEAWERLYGVGHNQAWKHSDIKNRPYQVVRDVFLSIIEKGSLK